MIIIISIYINSSIRFLYFSNSTEHLNLRLHPLYLEAHAVVCINEAENEISCEGT